MYNPKSSEMNEIIIYQTSDNTPKIEVKLQDENIWLSQQQIAELFQSSRTNVVEHIKNIYSEGELNELATCRKFRQVDLTSIYPSVEVGRSAKFGQWEEQDLNLRRLSPPILQTGSINLSDIFPDI